MARRRQDEGQDEGDGAAAALVALFALFLGGAGVVYGMDQQQKREQEAARFRQELAGLNAALAEKEAALTDLAARLGPKNEQVRLLAAEVEWLRAEVAQRAA